MECSPSCSDQDHRLISGCSQAGRRDRSVHLSPLRDLYLGSSHPAAQQRSRGVRSAINGSTFLPPSIGFFVWPHTGAGWSGGAAVQSYLSLFSLTHFSLIKFIKRWSAKCDKICNNSKKCPNSARKTDNMLGMALHGKNSCLHHKKHNKKFWKMILYYRNKHSRTNSANKTDDELPVWSPV